VKKCCICGKMKPYDEYYRNHKSEDGREKACKLCRGSFHRTTRKILNHDECESRTFRTFPVTTSNDRSVTIDYCGIEVTWSKREYARLTLIKEGMYDNT